MIKHRQTWISVCLLLLCSVLGCGRSPTPVAHGGAEKSAAASGSRQSGAARQLQPKTPRTNTTQSAAGTEATPAAGTPKADAQPTARRDANQPDTATPITPTPGQRRSLGDLLSEPADSMPHWVADLPRLEVDDARAAAEGIRKLSGRRLTLYTDLPAGEEIDRLPEVFDQAFPQWCEYFHVDPAEHADWNLTGFLMKDKARFQRAGLLPDDLPPFKNGYARNYELWLYEQKSDYYRRHLLLHEGTHGFMNTILRACGPPWYMEGIAELFGTHRWHDGRLTMRYFPQSRQEVPRWGRIEMIKEAVAAGRPMRLRDVIEYSVTAHLETEPYAWCWAAAMLLDRHPRYQQRFRRLYEDVSKPDFNQRFYRAMGSDWGRLCEAWQVFIAGLEFGYDMAAAVLDFTPGDPLPSGGATVAVAAQRGWQNSGLRLDAGASYRLQATGRYQVADQPQIWWCEPGGVSIRYYQGRPLGVLLAAVRPDQTDQDGRCALLDPAVVGTGATLSPKQSGTLYLKINDSAAELGDNAGQLEVHVKRQ
jgi:hypothetical protein